MVSVGQYMVNMYHLLQKITCNWDNWKRGSSDTRFHRDN